MAKQRYLHPPLAKWSGAARRVRLTLSHYEGDALKKLLESVTSTANVPLGTPGHIARRAAQTLAAEMLKARPHLYFLATGETYRTTLPESQALSLLAWMISSPAASLPDHDLRPLLDSLHRLLT